MSNLPEIHVDRSVTDIPEYLLGEFARRNATSEEEYRWYGNRSSYPDHLRRSKQEIVAAAVLGCDATPASEDSNAIVLGAGNCTDIPLSDLASIFNRTTLVDTHAYAMQRAVNASPFDTNQRIRLVRADITGVLGTFANRIMDVAVDARDYTSFMPSAAEAIADINPKGAQPDLGGNYAFVCSQLVLSQLGAIPLAFLDHVIKEKYDTELARSMPTNNPLRNAMRLFITNLQQAHVDLLTSLVAPTGTVHFADTHSQLTLTKAVAMFDARTVNASVQEHFASAREYDTPEAWLWEASPNRVFMVQSRILRTKQAEAQA